MAFFVFGPLWFVILVVVIVFIINALKSNPNNGSNYNHRSNNLQVGNNPTMNDISPNPSEETNTISTKQGLLLYNGRQCLNCLTMNDKEYIYCKNCGTKIVEDNPNN